MNYIESIKDIADLLDRNGLTKQADLLDKHLFKVAQAFPEGGEENKAELPSDEGAMPPPDTENRESKEEVSRTTFLMLSELRDFYIRNLQDFKYFGSDQIKTIQAAFDQLVTMYRVLLRNASKDFNKDAVRNYEQHLKKLQKEVDRSKKMKLTPVKVKIDKFLLYNEFEILLRKIERHYDGGLKELQPVLRKARSVRDAFGNIIQQTSEEIAHADLIEAT